MSTTNNKFSLERLRKIKRTDLLEAYLRRNEVTEENGSGRVVYLIPGRRYVIKLAINEEGLAQNEVEYKVSQDPLSKNVVARVYEHGPEMRWLRSELCKNIRNHFVLRTSAMSRWVKLWDKYDLVDDSWEIGTNYSGKRVLVDYGLDKGTYHTYYRMRRW